MRLVVDLVGSLSWPSFAVITLAIFRKPLKELLPHLHHLKGPGGWEADFGAETAEAERKSEALVTAGATLRLEAPEPIEWVDRLRRLADFSPRGAVLEAFVKVEGQIVRLAAPYGQPRRGVGFTAQRLANADVIDRGLLSVIDDLVGIRNQATHSPEFAIPSSAAISYIDAAANVVKALEKIGSTTAPEH
jgi:hypothetical protein